MKVVITDPGFAGFTGYFGSIYFEGGVSEEINAVEGERLGCIVRCETLDGQNPSATQRMNDSKYMNLDELAAAGRTSVGASSSEKQKPSQKPKTPKNPKAASKPTYTREQLEELADSEGINGVRNIGTQHGVKGTTIVEIINELVTLSEGSQE